MRNGSSRKSFSCIQADRPAGDFDFCLAKEIVAHRAPSLVVRNLQEASGLGAVPQATNIG